MILNKYLCACKILDSYTKSRLLLRTQQAWNVVKRNAARNLKKESAAKAAPEEAKFLKLVENLLLWLHQKILLRF